MKVLVFGATGSARSVLRVCLSAPAVEEARAITRRPLTLADGKLRGFVHADYLDYAAVEKAFAASTPASSAWGSPSRRCSGEAEYRKITHDFALAAVRALKLHSPGAVFHFISGQGARLDSRMMWARVKAETERDLMDFTDRSAGARPSSTARPGERAAALPGDPPAAPPAQGVPRLLRGGRGHRARHAPGDDRGDPRADHRERPRSATSRPVRASACAESLFPCRKAFHPGSAHTYHYTYLAAPRSAISRDLELRRSPGV